jgi:hypothetical protein
MPRTSKKEKVKERQPLDEDASIPKKLETKKNYQKTRQDGEKSKSATKNYLDSDRETQGAGAEPRAHQ